MENAAGRNRRVADHAARWLGAGRLLLSRRQPHHHLPRPADGRKGGLPMSIFTVRDDGTGLHRVTEDDGTNWSPLPCPRRPALRLRQKAAARQFRDLSWRSRKPAAGAPHLQRRFRWLPRHLAGRANAAVFVESGRQAWRARLHALSDGYFEPRPVRQRCGPVTLFTSRSVCRLGCRSSDLILRIARRLSSPSYLNASSACSCALVSQRALPG
jgi:hypothetical protein